MAVASPVLTSRESHAIEFIFRKQSGKKANNYLEDFLFATLLKVLRNGHVDIFLQVCAEINFPVTPDKTEWVTTIIVFLGILINTETQTISIPIEKHLKALKMLQELISACSITILKLQ